jgi:hypothetical protein
MLLRAWIGANECAITSSMPDHFSHCGAVSRDEPVPLRWPETITSKPPSSSARVLEHALVRRVEQARVGVERDVLGLVAEAHPGRRHHVGVDVVEQVSCCSS